MATIFITSPGFTAPLWISFSHSSQVWNIFLPWTVWISSDLKTKSKIQKLKKFKSTLKSITVNSETVTSNGTLGTALGTRLGPSHSVLDSVLDSVLYSVLDSVLDSLLDSVLDSVLHSVLDSVLHSALYWTTILSTSVNGRGILFLIHDNSWMP